MHLFKLFLASSVITAGAFAAPVDEASKAPQLVDRQTCVAPSLAQSTLFNEDTEDFTDDPTDDSSSKKRSVGPDAIVDSEILEREVNGIDVALEARDGQHQCTIPGGQANTGVYIFDTTSRNTVAEGFRRLGLGFAGRAYTANGVNFYPKRFYNNENIADINYYCPGGPWFEYPVYSNPYRLFGLSDFNPGPDRVIFDRCGNWCAVITHRGEWFNTFHECYEA